MRIRLGVLGLLPLLTAGCLTTRTSSTTWGAAGSPSAPERQGQVEWIQETVQQQQGNPAGGAVAGAIVGGLLGHAILGRAGGTLVGAVGGAAVGASASQGTAEGRTYQVAVRFDDGGERVFLVGGCCPFRVGDAVNWTPSGLRRNRTPNFGRPDLTATPPEPPPRTCPRLLRPIDDRESGAVGQT